MLKGLNNWRSVVLGIGVLLGLGCSANSQLANAPVAMESGLSAVAVDQPSPAQLALPAQVALDDPATVWGQLQRAEERLYVVLLRHAIAPGTGDPANFRLGDCSTQRNLSAAGQAQAQQLGQAFRRRQVDVAQVLSSEWCRCLDTATLMELGPVQPFAPINSFFRDRSTAAQQTAQLENYIRQQPSRGVIVMVTHQVNITALTGVVPASGQAVVVTPNDEGQLIQVGLLDADL
jgi:phosphohistidine phosphatase SixA